MKKIKLIWMVIFLLLLSACQATPDVADRNGLSIASNSENTLSETIEFEKKETEMSAKSDLSVIEPIIYNYSDGEITINVNADVSSNSNINMHTYTYIDHTISNSEVENIMAAFFGEQYEQLEYDEDNDIYILNKENDQFIVENLNTNRIRISGRALNLCPYDSNRFDYDTELSFSSEDAINNCDKFIEEAGLNGYVFSHLVSYGKNEGVPYYKITYKYMLDNKYVTTDFCNSDITFNCIDSGIYSVKGNLFDYALHDENVTIMSANEAIQYLYKYSNNIVVYCNIDKNSNFLDISDENGRVLLFDIKYINNEYILNYENKLVPSWRFYLSPNGIDVDKDIVLAVDALNGEVIVR